MADEAWRAHERRWRQEPSDQDALGRAIAGLRRSGLVVPPDLLDARIEPATALETTLPLEVWAVLPGEREPTTVGWGPGRVEVPPHRYWGVGDVPAGLEGLGALGDELRSRAIPGLRLTQLAPSRRRPEEEPLLDRDALAALGPQPQLLWLELPRHRDQPTTAGQVVQALRSPSLEVFRGELQFGEREGKTGSRLTGFEELLLLREVELTDFSLRSDDLVALAPLPQLEALSLSGSTLGFADLERLGFAPRLRRARLDMLEPADVERARGFERLASVGLESRDADSVADAIAAIPSLREIELHLDGVGSGLPSFDAALLRWRELPLTRLALRYGAAGPAGFEALGAVTTLRALDLHGVSTPGPAGLGALGACVDLEELHVTLQVEQPCGRFPTLRHLRSVGLGLFHDPPERIFGDLGGLPRLQELRLVSGYPTRGTLTAPGLRSLDVRHAQVSGLRVEANLRNLTVGRVEHLWPELDGTMERLRIASALGDAEIKRLSACEALRTLQLAPGEDHPDLPERVVQIAGAIPGLRRLSLEGWAWGKGLPRQVHDAIARRVAEELPWVGVVDEVFDD